MIKIARNQLIPCYFFLPNRLEKQSSKTAPHNPWHTRITESNNQYRASEIFVFSCATPMPMRVARIPNRRNHRNSKMLPFSTDFKCSFIFIKMYASFPIMTKGSLCLSLQGKCSTGNNSKTGRKPTKNLFFYEKL